MDYKSFLDKLNFVPKEKASGIFIKKYPQVGGYVIEVDSEKQRIDYGSEIKIGRNTCLILNEKHKENYVTLECVNRLLEMDYKPENIFLEKAYPAGRGSTKYLDILVSQNKKPYLMIECKTYGEEFEDELKNMKNTGGQLFSYFQQDTKTNLLMLYSSDFKDNQIISQTKIIKIEEKFRKAGSVKERHKLWDKKFYEKGFWENSPYNFQPKKFTKSDLKVLTEDEGKKLFHGFATILRKHSVSDKPNAFNVIFNLFLAKLYDEQKRDEDELDFQWKENDNPVDFQIRLYNLHKEGLFDFLKKEIEGIKEEDFDAKQTIEEKYKAKKKFLKFNKLFDIKSVIDDDDFEQNHRVLLEVVKLLQNYQIRYPRKQKYLSEFFELLLTTGLKQEVGQYFTPPPIAKFIVKSLPLSTMIEQAVNQPTPSLPVVVDYAAGSGHFITEILEEYQDIIENLDVAKFYPKAKEKVKSWKADQYNWASTYVYGIEKDYRLVKVAKVGCYFYGDGLAQVIHGDGLDSFEKSKSYVGLLKDNAHKPQFSILVSNPPYSVDDVKDDLEYIGVQNEFKLFKNLTAKSSEIEALFIERMSQLLKENGVAGVILPSTILSNGGIYAKARELILQSFDIVAITQLGGNTFMATNTNTVVLFLRKRESEEIKRTEANIDEVIENYTKTGRDLTINGIEKPVRKYLDYTGETKIDFEKFYYFVLNYHKKIVVVKTGEKDDEKKFLGYKIVKRRGNEGYHPISGKTIDGCTKLYDDNENETKANFYISKAFNGKFPKIHESLKDNVFYANLIDMLTFDREKFDKSISLVVKKKIKIQSKWNLAKLGEIAEINTGTSAPQGQQYFVNGNKPFVRVANLNHTDSFGYIIPEFCDKVNNLAENDLTLKSFYSGTILFPKSGQSVNTNNIGRLKIDSYVVNHCATVYSENEILLKYIFEYLCFYGTSNLKNGMSNYPTININEIQNFQIALPPKEIQQKIVTEIEILEKKMAEAEKNIDILKTKISEIIENKWKKTKLGEIANIIRGVTYSKEDQTLEPTKNIVLTADNITLNGNFELKKEIFLRDNLNVPEEKRLKKNDIFMCFSSGSKEHLGKVAFIENNTKYLAGGFMGIIRVKPEMEPKYLFQLLNSLLRQPIRDLGSGTNINNLSSVINEIQIPLPPKDIQEKIISNIEKIEKQIAEVQKIINEIPAQKNDVLKKYEIC